MDSEALFTGLIILFILGLLPIMIKGKNNKNSSIVVILSIISVIAIIPSLMLQLDFGQSFIIFLWLISLILSIIGRNKDKNSRS